MKTPQPAFVPSRRPRYTYQKKNKFAGRHEDSAFQHWCEMVIFTSWDCKFWHHPAEIPPESWTCIPLYQHNDWWDTSLCIIPSLAELLVTLTRAAGVGGGGVLTHGHLSFWCRFLTAPSGDLLVNNKSRSLSSRGMTALWFRLAILDSGILVGIKAWPALSTEGMKEGEAAGGYSYIKMFLNRYVFQQVCTGMGLSAGWGAHNELGCFRPPQQPGLRGFFWLGALKSTSGAVLGIAVVFLQKEHGKCGRPVPVHGLSELSTLSKPTELWVSEGVHLKVWLTVWNDPCNPC